MIVILSDHFLWSIRLFRAALITVFSWIINTLFPSWATLRLLVCVLAAVSQDLCCWPQRWYDILYKHSLQPQPKSIEWFIEDQAFSPSYDFATPLPSSSLIPPANCLSLSVLLCVTGRAYWRERGGRSQIIRQRESLVLCKSLYTLWLSHITVRLSQQPSPSHPMLLKNFGGKL